MSDHQSEARIARDNADRIARILRIKKAKRGVRAKTKRLFETIIFDYINGETSGRQTCARIRGLHAAGRNHTRDFEIFTLILEHLWLISPKSELIDELSSFAYNCYMLLMNGRPSQKRSARRSVREALSSTFSGVRSFAIHLKRGDEVHERELSSLMDTSVFRDVRESVAQRIIEHQQVDHVEALFVYIKHICGHEDSVEQVKRLLNQLSSWPPAPDYLKQLFDCYLEDSYAISDVKGLVMRNLTEKGETLAAPLAHLYREEADKRDAILRLLSHMVSYGQIPALNEMLKLCEEPISGDAPEELKHGLRKLSTKSHRAADQLWRALSSWIEERRGVSALQPLIRDLEKTREVITLSLEDLENLLSGSKKEVWKLRHAVPSPFEDLRRVAMDVSESTQRRSRAIELAGMVRVHIESKRGLFVQLLEEPQARIKRACITELAKLGPHERNETLREPLQILSQDPVLGLGEVIRDKWGDLFKGVMPESIREGDE